MPKISELAYTESLEDITYLLGGTATSLKRCAVNLFSDASASVDVPGDFLSLLDTPDAYTGQAGKVIAVNTAADSLEFIDPPSGGESGGTISGAVNIILYNNFGGF